MGEYREGKIDLIGYHPDRDEVGLYVVHTEGWDPSDEGLARLRQRIDDYLVFALDGPLAETYPEMRRQTGAYRNQRLRSVGGLPTLA
jgi:hypothetical protein